MASQISHKSSLHILMVTNNYTPYTGGVVSSIDAFTEQLRRMGHTVTIVTFDFLGAHAPFTHQIAIRPNTLMRIASPIRFVYQKKHIAIAYRPKRFLEKVMGQLCPDVVHIHHPFLLGNWAQKVAHQYQIPTVFTYHTWYQKFTHDIPLPQWVIEPIATHLVKKFCQSVSHIVSPSSAIKQLLITQHITQPISIIASPILPIYIPKNPPPHLVKKKNRYNLITVCRFSPEKNIALLLDVVARLDHPYTFTIIGYGTEYHALQDKAFNQLHLSPDHIKFIYKPDKAVIAHQYQTADLFLFASTIETQGIVFAEAIANGTPVITLSGPGQQDIVVSGYNGFIVSSRTQMIRTLERCMRNPELLSQLQHNAYQTGQSYYPEPLTKKLVACYQSLQNE